MTMQCVDANAIVSTEHPNGVILGTCQQSTTLQAKSYQEGQKLKSNLESKTSDGLSVSPAGVLPRDSQILEKILKIFQNWI